MLALSERLFRAGKWLLLLLALWVNMSLVFPGLVPPPRTPLLLGRGRGSKKPKNKKKHQEKEEGGDEVTTDDDDAVHDRLDRIEDRLSQIVRKLDARRLRHGGTPRDETGRLDQIERTLGQVLERIEAQSSSPDGSPSPAEERHRQESPPSVVSTGTLSSPTTVVNTRQGEVDQRQQRPPELQPPDRGASTKFESRPATMPSVVPVVPQGPASPGSRAGGSSFLNQSVNSSSPAQQPPLLLPQGTAISSQTQAVPLDPVEAARQASARILWERKGEIEQDDDDFGINASTHRSASALLRSTPVFANAPEDFRAKIEPFMVKEYFAKSRAIVVEGDYGACMYFIVKGVVQGSRKGHTFGFSDGDFFGEIAILRGGVRSATCTAMEDSFLLSLSRDVFLSALSTHPQVRDDMERIVLTRFVIEKYPFAQRSDPEVLAKVEAVVEEQFKRWKRLKNETISFHMGEKIGSGAAGSVHSCINSKTGQPLAVKVIRIPGLSRKKKEEQDDSNNNNNANAEGGLTLSDQKGAAELSVEQESAMMQNLRHPNVVQGYGMQRDPQDPEKLFVMMELAPLGSLHKVIRQLGKLSELAARSYVRQALLGLKYLHENGVIHRDIKPSNMLLGATGSVKLADFGISTVLQATDGASEVTGGLSICGTPAYMSPDAINGRYSIASDIWAMGCSLLEMITGRAPWSYHPFDNSTQLLFHIATCGASPNIPRSHSMVEGETVGGSVQHPPPTTTASAASPDKKTRTDTFSEQTNQEMDGAEKFRKNNKSPQPLSTTTTSMPSEVEDAFRRFHFRPEVDCSGAALPDCSPELVTLLAQMLAADPASRGDVQSILAHDWFVVDEAQLLPDASGNFEMAMTDLHQPSSASNSATNRPTATISNPGAQTTGGSQGSLGQGTASSREGSGEEVRPIINDYHDLGTVMDGSINLDGLE